MSHLQHPIALLVGVGLAIGAGTLASVSRLERDRAVYPLMLIITASYYVLFGIECASTLSIGAEITIACAFVFAALHGFKRSLWVVVVAFVGHGILDVLHNDVIANPGVPIWWPPFCLMYDITAAVYLSWRITRSKIESTQLATVTATNFAK